MARLARVELFAADEVAVVHVVNRVVRQCFLLGDDAVPGKNYEHRKQFWQSRYRAVRLMDEESLLACAAYVDLNLIRAALAETLEASDHTSAQRRIEAERARAGSASDAEKRDLPTDDRPMAETPATTWCELVSNFGRLFWVHVAVRPCCISFPGPLDANGR